MKHVKSIKKCNYSTRPFPFPQLFCRFTETKIQKNMFELHFIENIWRKNIWNDTKLIDE
jgi:hypothetical protein